MSGKVIVLVSDLDDASHGEVNIMESPDHAAHFVETLLESGFEQERIRIFGGDEMQMQVRHRPVVSLLDTDRRDQKEEPLREVAPQPQEEPAEEVRVAPAAHIRTVEYEKVAAEPFIRNGVRFSSMFKPA